MTARPRPFLLHLLLACFLFSFFALQKDAYAQADLYIRGAILHFTAFPKEPHLKDSYHYWDDGLLIVQSGKIKQVGDWSTLKSTLPQNATITHYSNGLIVPGFIDTHIHYPQLDMIAANGYHLIDWLKHYTFPFEQKFQNSHYANDVANAFTDELIKNGTTTALVFTTVYPQAVDAIFTAAEKKHMRLIAGKVVADRNVPAFLQETPEEAYRRSEQLIHKWHKKPNTRLLYALTLRFPPSTSPALFEKIQLLKERYPDVYIHTHLSENQEEVQWVKQLFNGQDYLQVYENYHLLGPKTLLAHSIYLDDKDFTHIRDTHSAIAFCPTSNLFLGSGLFNFQKAIEHEVLLGLGTDIGAGTSFSLLQTLNEAYKVAQLQKQNITALQGFYLATLGGAKALDLEDRLGNFTPGKEADFVVLNLSGATSLLKRRLAYAPTLQEKLFALMMLGDDRSILATYIEGKLSYTRACSHCD